MVCTLMEAMRSFLTLLIFDVCRVAVSSRVRCAIIVSMISWCGKGPPAAVAIVLSPQAYGQKLIFAQSPSLAGLALVVPNLSDLSGCSPRLFGHSTSHTMDARLAQLASVSVQKDKAAGYLSLLNDLLAAKRQSSADILKFVDVVVTQEHVGLVIGRQLISELVKALETKQIAEEDVRRPVIEGALQILQPRIVTYEEQVSL